MAADGRSCAIAGSHIGRSQPGGTGTGVSDPGYSVVLELVISVRL